MFFWPQHSVSSQPLHRCREAEDRQCSVEPLPRPITGGVAQGQQRTCCAEGQGNFQVTKQASNQRQLGSPLLLHLLLRWHSYSCYHLNSNEPCCTTLEYFLSWVALDSHMGIIMSLCLFQAEYAWHSATNLPPTGQRILFNFFFFKLWGN